MARSYATLCDRGNRLPRGYISCAPYAASSTVRYDFVHEADMQRIMPLTLVLLTSLLFAGCEAIAGIFRAGVWTGVIIVIIIVAIIGFIVSRARGR
jgi:hypothetical protein